MRAAPLNIVSEANVFQLVGARITILQEQLACEFARSEEKRKNCELAVWATIAFLS